MSLAAAPTSPSANRRQRAKDALRDQILDATRDLILAEGVEAVSMRKVAERVQYSPAALYKLFPDKEALLLGMCRRDFARFAQALTERGGDVADPVERILVAGETYVRFALEFPGHFRLMFMTPPIKPEQLTPEILADKDNPETDGYAFLKVAVIEAIATGRFRPNLRDEELITQTLWATVHGVATLTLTHASDAWVNLAPAEDRLRCATDAVLRGLLRRPDEMDKVRAAHERRKGTKAKRRRAGR